MIQQINGSNVNLKSDGILEKLDFLLGKDAVLLSVPKGSKKAKTHWNKMTLARSRSTAYRKKLQRGGNIGIIQGEKSNGICSIDLDSDKAAKEFFKLNPKLKGQTLLTRGARGVNIWVKIVGSYPRINVFNGWGEWRSTGGYTLIYGKHPDGMDYKFIEEKSVIEISFTDINWPDPIRGIFEGQKSPTTSNTNQPPPPNSFCISASLNTLHTLHNNPVVKAIEADDKIEKNLQIFRMKEPELSHLFDEHVGRFEPPRPNVRNKHLVDNCKRLFYRVGIEIAIKLQLAIHDIYAPIFHDSKKQHERESREMMKLALETYLNDLPELDRAVYMTLPSDLHRDAFRILRDLAYRNSETLFFMPCCSLKLRIGLKYDIEAHRILNKFIDWGILTLEKVGQKREPGKKAMASEYKWRLDTVDL